MDVVNTSAELQDEEVIDLKRHHGGLEGLVEAMDVSQDMQNPEGCTENSIEELHEEENESTVVGAPEDADQTPIFCILCDAEVRGKWAYRKHIIKHQEAAQKGQDPTEELLAPSRQDKQEEDVALAHSLHCSVCPFETKVPRDLERHYHTHFVGYRCLLCKFTTLHRTRLAAHYPLHKKERMRFECRICGATLSSTSALKKHVARHSEGTICCELCEYKTYDQFLLREHLATKHNDVRKKYKCEHCDREFGTFKRFFQHRQEAHKGFVYKRQVDPKICDKCDFQSTKIKEMNAHKLSHQGMVDILANGRYVCRIQGCADTFSSASKYEMHFTKVHDKHNLYGLRTERGRNCEVAGCTFSTVRDSHLKLHMRVHQSQSKTVGGENAKAEKKKRAQGTCHICMAKFSDKYKVRSHIETVHSNLKPHECEMCCYKTAYKYNMKIHMKKLHNVEYRGTKSAIEEGLAQNTASSFQDQVGNLNVEGSSGVTFLQTTSTGDPTAVHERPEYPQEYESESEYGPAWGAE